MASPLVQALETAKETSQKAKPSQALKRALKEIEAPGRVPAQAGRGALRRPELWFKVARAEEVQGLAIWRHPK